MTPKPNPLTTSNVLAAVAALGEARTREVADRVKISMPAARRYLNRLEAAGLITSAIGGKACPQGNPIYWSIPR